MWWLAQIVHLLIWIPIFCGESYIFVCYKVKSERVNALRKQYDAFLEEDKIRKERNEYILGKLDNMRYSTTAVQIRHKPVVVGDLLPVYNRVVYRPDPFERHEVPIPHQQISGSNRQNLQLDIPRPYLDDTTLLKEISKKYILIPKIRSSPLNDYIGIVPPQSLPAVTVSSPQTNVTSNEDWKSKYDILKQLKKNETEEIANELGKEALPVKESQITTKDNSDQIIEGYDLQSYNTKEYTRKYEQEVPEKDLTFSKVKIESKAQNVEQCKKEESKILEPGTLSTPLSTGYAYINPDINKVNDIVLQNQNVEFNEPVQESVINTNNNEETVQQYNYSGEDGTTSEYNTEDAAHIYNSVEQKTDIEPQQEYPIEYEPVADDGSKFPDPENVYLDQDDYSPIQVINPSQLVEEIQRDIPAKSDASAREDEIVDYPVDMINVQEFTPNDDVKLEDGVNVNPVYLASEENAQPESEENPESDPTEQQSEEQQIQNTEHNLGIEAFDTEQREMFYSEDTNAYAYEQQQQAVDDAAQSYAPVEGYQQPDAQDYAYYEGATGLQEQEYPAEINENEEATARYDQSYEQQYAADYDQQAYDQGQEQQYVQPVEGYDQNQQQYQDYEYQQQDQETVQNVEQVLDNEENQAYYAETENLEGVLQEPVEEQQASENITS